MDCIAASYVNGSKAGQSRTKQCLSFPLYGLTSMTPCKLPYVTSQPSTSPHQSSLLSHFCAMELLPCPLSACASPIHIPPALSCWALRLSLQVLFLPRGQLRSTQLHNKQIDTVTHRLRTAASVFGKGRDSFGGRHMLSPPAVSFISSPAS